MKRSLHLFNIIAIFFLSSFLISSAVAQEAGATKSAGVAQKLELLIQRYDAAVAENKILRERLEKGQGAEAGAEGTLRLERELEAAKNKLTDLERERTALVDQVDALTKELNQPRVVTSQDLDSSSSALKQQIEDLQDELSAAKALAAQKATDAALISVLKDEVVKLQSRLEETEKIYASQRIEGAQVQQLYGAIAGLKDELAVKGEFIKDGNERIDQLSQQNEQLQKELEVLRAGTDPAAEAGSPKDSKKDTLIKELKGSQKDLQNKVRVLEKNLRDQKMKSASELEKSRREAQDKIKDLEKKLKAAEARSPSQKEKVSENPS